MRPRGAAETHGTHRVPFPALPVSRVNRAFDPDSGAVALDSRDGRLLVGPGLTRSAFLATPVGAAAPLILRNDPHASWRVDATLDGRPFAVGLYFEGERLGMLILALTDPAFGTGWSDWTRERELARKAAHEAWLAEADPTIGEGRDEPWGFVSSVLDEKSGGAEIVIRYDARLPEPLPVSPIRYLPAE